RVSSNEAIFRENAEMKENLERQAERLVEYCVVKGWQVQKIVKEIASGLNDGRPKLEKLLADTSITVIVVEHRDRLTRFGYHYIETLLSAQGRRIEVVNLANNGKDELMEDLVSIVYSFSARLYGQRRAKHKTEKIVQELKAQDDATG
ncbi:MAG: IS607 family transposase, partial [Anaerolineae bacterium]